VNLELQKQAEYEMQQRLESIPLAKSFPMSRHEILDKEIELLEKAIKRLNAFVRFLSLLSPTKYIEWMKAAYARYVPSPSKVAPSSTDFDEEHNHSFERNEKSLSQKPTKTSKKSAKKRFSII
jgi:hypothetical protein